MFVYSCHWLWNIIWLTKNTSLVNMHAGLLCWTMDALQSMILLVTWLLIENQSSSQWPKMQAWLLNIINYWLLTSVSSLFIPGKIIINFSTFIALSQLTDCTSTLISSTWPLVIKYWKYDYYVVIIIWLWCISLYCIWLNLLIVHERVKATPSKWLLYTFALLNVIYTSQYC